MSISSMSISKYTRREDLMISRRRPKVERMDTSDSALSEHALPRIETELDLVVRRVDPQLGTARLRDNQKWRCPGIYNGGAAAGGGLSTEDYDWLVMPEASRVAAGRFRPTPAAANTNTNTNIDATAAIAFNVTSSPSSSAAAAVSDVAHQLNGTHHFPADNLNSERPREVPSAYSFHTTFPRFEDTKETFRRSAHLLSQAHVRVLRNDATARRTTKAIHSEEWYDEDGTFSPPKPVLLRQSSMAMIEEAVNRRTGDSIHDRPDLFANSTSTLHPVLKNTKNVFNEEESEFAPQVVDPAKIKLGLDGVAVLRGEFDQDLNELEKMNALRMRGIHSNLNMRQDSLYPINAATHRKVAMSQVDQYVGMTNRAYGFFLAAKERHRTESKQDSQNVLKGRLSKKSKLPKANGPRLQLSTSTSAKFADFGKSRFGDAESAKNSVNNDRGLDFLRSTSASFDDTEFAENYIHNLGLMLSMDENDEFDAKQLKSIVMDTVNEADGRESVVDDCRLTSKSFMLSSSNNVEGGNHVDPRMIADRNKSQQARQDKESCPIEQRRPNSARMHMSSSAFIEDIPFNIDAIRATMTAPRQSFVGEDVTDSQTFPLTLLDDESIDSLISSLKVHVEPFHTAYRDTKPTNVRRAMTPLVSSSANVSLATPHGRSNGSFMTMKLRNVDKDYSPIQPSVPASQQSLSTATLPSMAASNNAATVPPIGFSFSKTTGLISEVHFLSQQPKPRPTSADRKNRDEIEREAPEPSAFEDEYLKFLLLQESKNHRKDLKKLVMISNIDSINEKNNLMDIFRRCNGRNWTRSDNWGSNRPVREWYGISVTVEGYIFEIHLSNNNLVGPFPDTLNDFPMIEVVQLDHNQLDGVLPDFCIQNCRKLRVLSARYNKLEGVIPFNFFTGLVFLQEVWLNNNQFSGKLEDGLVKIKSLTHLALHNNNLEGEIPHNISKLKKLKYLSLSCNRFRGHIPKSIIALHELETLSLHTNCLSGMVPDWIYSISTLDEFDVYENPELEIPQKFINHRFHRKR